MQRGCESFKRQFGKGRKEKQDTARQSEFLVANCNSAKNWNHQMAYLRAIFSSLTPSAS